jgi:hypothetical protein
MMILLRARNRPHLLPLRKSGIYVKGIMIGCRANNHNYIFSYLRYIVLLKRVSSRIRQLELPYHGSEAGLGQLLRILHRIAQLVVRVALTLLLEYTHHLVIPRLQSRRQLTCLLARLLLRLTSASTLRHFYRDARLFATTLL